MPRTLSPYEQTHLARFGKSGITIDDYGDMPVEYITGKVEFYRRVFEVTPAVLIPRIETEELITLAVEEVKKMAPSQRRNPITIADVGTGSGAIGITLHLELNRLDITNQLYLSEVSPSALAIAQKNVAQLVDDPEQFVLLQSDILASYPTETKFDLMVANLPYIPSPRIEYLDESVKSFEPHLALDGGPDGLTLIQTFLRHAPKYVKPGGKILLEVDHTHTEAELTQENLKLHIVTTTDSFGQQRFALIEVAQP